MRSRRHLAGVAALMLVTACGGRTPIGPPPVPAPVPRPAPTVTPPDSTPHRSPTAPTTAPSHGLRTWDSTVVFERPNGALLRPAALVYALFSQRDTLRTALGVRTVVVQEATLAGVSSWLVTEARTGTSVETSDSLYLSRADLTPERWSAWIGKSQIAVSFSRDSMFGAAQTYQGRSSFAAPLPAGALLTAGMVERIVELLPLELGYRAAGSLVLLEMGTPRLVPGQLLVDHEERIALADREVVCWVVTLRAGPLAERLWVTKEAPRVVKTEQTTGSGVLTAMLQP